MKKKYVKPQAYFESFELSSNIANGCQLISHHSSGDCKVTDPDTDIITFTESIGCNYTPVDGDNKICYHNPFPDTNVFTS